MPRKRGENAVIANKLLQIVAWPLRQRDPAYNSQRPLFTTAEHANFLRCNFIFKPFTTSSLFLMRASIICLHLCTFIIFLYLHRTFCHCLLVFYVINCHMSALLSIEKMSLPSTLALDFQSFSSNWWSVVVVNNVYRQIVRLVLLLKTRFKTIESIKGQF